MSPRGSVLVSPDRRSRPTLLHATAPLLIGNKRHSDSRFELNLQGRPVAWSNKKGEEA